MTNFMTFVNRSGDTLQKVSPIDDPPAMDEIVVIDRKRYQVEAISREYVSSGSSWTVTVHRWMDKQEQAGRYGRKRRGKGDA